MPKGLFILFIYFTRSTIRKTDTSEKRDCDIFTSWSFSDNYRSRSFSGMGVVIAGWTINWGTKNIQGESKRFSLSCKRRPRLRRMVMMVAGSLLVVFPEGMISVKCWRNKKKHIENAFACLVNDGQVFNQRKYEGKYTALSGGRDGVMSRKRWRVEWN